jgi:hypothetical protein
MGSISHPGFRGRPAACLGYRRCSCAHSALGFASGGGGALQGAISATSQRYDGRIFAPSIVGHIFAHDPGIVGIAEGRLLGCWSWVIGTNWLAIE